MTDTSPSLSNRYDIVYLFDITDGNPNGDPDAGNMPRVAPETGQGLVTDVCLKRKIRNYIGLLKECEPPYEIYVKERAVLNNEHNRAWEEVAPKVKKGDRKSTSAAKEKAEELTAWMCKNFFDIRTFGAVMTTEINCGQVRGPVQIGIARSVHPVVPQEFAVTRCAVTTEKEAAKQLGGNRTIGRKFTVPYGLYRVHLFINPHLADKTGFSENDLDLLKQSLSQMFEIDRSAARANMRPVRCIAFKHDSKLGSARADELFSRVTITQRDGVQPIGGWSDDIEGSRPPRGADDYDIQVDQGELPSGVSVEEWV
ncbi:type I-C CRISPR-associated protein Cas7/Csd2 [Rhodopirellula sp. MGV]|uniref:type I-C CRISPR-associated protein Cas7/Csd2 n=1 Tax=Rhodopirellula sp. MGV TaxID=2023130 RepID=UPI000B97B2FB|nr:type I-C CRISPR-associated protein Cas7/Csd2 [Rhodopirellula sp. MGV]OYP35554.1 type I-C CRISPR-associated protein Cas7/Csd2 [Rhodopirellula sp. MGV]PNY34591.1 type I-C CRISPR-associated protein Cas7/Csd2 [Rhodopirellula baltica]